MFFYIDIDSETFGTDTPHYTLFAQQLVTVNCLINQGTEKRFATTLPPTTYILYFHFSLTVLTCFNLVILTTKNCKLNGIPLRADTPVLVFSS